MCNYFSVVLISFCVLTQRCPGLRAAGVLNLVFQQFPRRKRQFCVCQMPNTQPSNLRSILLSVFICMFMWLFCILFLFLRIRWNTRPNTPRTYCPGFVQQRPETFLIYVWLFSDRFNFTCRLLHFWVTPAIFPSKDVPLFPSWCYFYYFNFRDPCVIAHFRLPFYWPTVELLCVDGEITHQLPTLRQVDRLYDHDLPRGLPDWHL